MPHKWQTERVPLPREYDRRRKLTDEQRDQIRAEAGELSQRALARKYKVDRQSIKFILYPDKYEHAKKLNRERRKDGRYKPTREKWAAIMRDYRQYKTRILKEGR